LVPGPRRVRENPFIGRNLPFAVISENANLQTALDAEEAKLRRADVADPRAHSIHRQLPSGATSDGFPSARNRANWRPMAIMALTTLTGDAKFKN
jgi:hypothetical protein